MGGGAAAASAVGDGGWPSRWALARWRLPLERLTQALPTSNPALRELYEAECARLLADLDDSADLAAQTRRLLRKLEGLVDTWVSH